MHDRAKHELQYQTAPSPVTRGQIRLLLLLMLIQVVMTAQSNYAPGILQWVKNAWAKHQQAVAHRAEVKKNRADLGQCLAYSQPSDKVVWDEDPRRAAKLLAAGGYQPIVPSGQSSDFFSDAVLPGASADLPELLPASVPPALTLSGVVNNSLIFMHARRAAGEPERLVAVGMHSDVRTTEQGGLHETTDTFDGAVWKWQTLVARSFGLDSEDGTPTWDRSATTSLHLQQGNDATQLRAHWAAATQPGNPGKLTVQYSDQLRLYAGQIDPADTSHFTITYDLDGQTGVIDGWLKADRIVVLQPRLGKVVNSVWYPHAK